MVKAAARIAKVSTELPGWKSAWCIYDRFCDEDETDETYYWQNEFYKLIMNETPDFDVRGKRVWDRFISMYRSFEPRYRALPQAFFQGDEGGLNAMLDSDGRFVGLLDFNLAGAETVLNYFFREFCRVRINGEGIAMLGNAAFLCGKDDEMKARINIVKKYYRFSDAEKAAFPVYYNMVYPLECDNCQLFQSVIRTHDARKIALVLDWIEYQQTRDDIARWL